VLDARQLSGTTVRSPGNLFVALRTNELGVVVQAVGAFDEADARLFVNVDYDGQGYIAPFELVFRSPRPESRSASGPEQ
jgi:hypothetical protein